MNAHTSIRPPKMTVAEYFEWDATQPKGRRELIHGEVVEMAAERNIHWMLKLAVLDALRDAAQHAGIDCIIAPDGPTIVIDDCAFEPDCLVQLKTDIDLRALTLDAPVILVEVSSPSTRRRDEGVKVSQYFRIPSVEHYLIVYPDPPQVAHLRRDGEGVRTTFHDGGSLMLDPPGLTLDIGALFPA